MGPLGLLTFGWAVRAGQRHDPRESHMFNADSVIKFAIEARNAHAHEVGKALDAFIAEQTPDTRAPLRIALVAMSLGHESSAHDGSTREARIAAAPHCIATGSSGSPLLPPTAKSCSPKGRSMCWGAVEPSMMAASSSGVLASHRSLEAGGHRLQRVLP